MAAGRDLTPEQVEQVAQGRVWSAPDALEHGLLDGLGSEDAIAAAAARAGLEEYAVEYVSRPFVTPGVIPAAVGGSRRRSADPGTLGTAASLACWRRWRCRGRVANLKDPRHLYARCLECGAIR